MDNRRFRMTGEFRPPKAGEWYISGAIPEAYKALMDFTSSFQIAKEVIVTKKVIETVTDKE
jgi:hypothetical protein